MDNAVKLQPTMRAHVGMVTMCAGIQTIADIRRFLDCTPEVSRNLIRELNGYDADELMKGNWVHVK
jgi:hypothetical protein